MDIIMDWPQKLAETQYKIRAYGDEIPLTSPVWQDLKDLPPVEKLSEDNRFLIGNPSDDFNRGLEYLGDCLCAHDVKDDGWPEAWQTMRTLSDYGYPMASLQCAQVSLAFVGEHPEMLPWMDYYATQAKNSPCASEEMKNYVDMHQRFYDSAFNHNFPDLNEPDSVKQFTLDDADRAGVAIDALMVFAQQKSDPCAYKRLKTLCERGYKAAEQAVNTLQGVRVVFKQDVQAPDNQPQHE